MSRIRNMVRDWNDSSVRPPAVAEMSVSLGARDYGRIRALAEIYAGMSEQQIVRDLISAALDEVEEAMPYVQGETVIAHDEFGDPVYEDVGLTPRFEALTHKYAQHIEEE